MTLRLDALIEHWPAESVLYVRALPGFHARGHDPADLQWQSGSALQAHLDWLVERELIDAPSGDVELTIAEEATAPSESIGPTFHADLVAMDDQEIEIALAIGRAAVSDVIDAYDAGARGTTSSVLASAIHSIARIDRWYASRLSGEHAQPASGDPIDELVAAAGALEDAVDRFVLAGNRELFEREGEQWTLAKVLRRRTAHLRGNLLQPTGEQEDP
jgi:hypothetical protein